MKRNSKKFLALFMAVAMSVTPTTALYAEEMNDADKLQNVGEQLKNTETEENHQDIVNEVDKKEDIEKKSQEDTVQGTQDEIKDIQNNDSLTEVQPENKLSEETEQTKEIQKDKAQENESQKNTFQEEAEQLVEAFKAEKVEAVILNGKIQVTVSTNNQDYDKIYIGKKEAIDQAQEVTGKENSLGGFDFIFETEAENLGQKLQFVPHLKEQNVWYLEKDMYLDMPEEAQFPELLTSVNEASGANLLSMAEVQAIEVPAGHKSVELIDGASYKATAETGESMFKVVDCVVKSTESGMTAVITLSGTGYDYLYMGTAEEAAKADQSSYIKYKEVGGKYTYEIPVEALNTAIKVSSHSIRKNKWYDRTVTIIPKTTKVDAGENKSDSENPGKDDSGNSGSSGNPGGTGGSSNSTGSSSGTNAGNNGSQNGNNSDNQYSSSTNGTTSRVNTSTRLEDGTYKPDGFLWSGGTGKVGITCSQIRISGGQAYATITFSSSHYQYVKANGSKYLPVSQGGSTTFEIPVELNKNNKIIGMTTAMSQAHEITYSIFVYLAGAQAAEGSSVIGAGMASESKKLDQEAPSIIGLEYQGEVELNHAQYFKIYEYEQGIKLLEIDLASGTPRENQEDESGEVQQSTEMTQSGRVETKTTDQSKKEEEQTEDGASEVSQNQSEQEDKSELYLNNIVKYLIVPDGVEIPVGLDKETIVIQQPTDKTYVASDVILDKLEQLGALNQVKAVASEEKDCTNEIIKNALKDKSVDSIGKYDEPDYKKLIKDECNLTVMDTEILPQEDSETQETLEDQLNTMKEILSKYDTLNIPVFIDRSIDEEDELAQAEWLKVYGAIFGCEDKAEAIYAELTK
ncbi:hypothetical protein DWX78_01305 [Dorea formicigenerans]|uniref:Uncharacterized protein n=1 Tax=Dorea formicigenerans TaxID=39486 RepID=A0A412KXI2_9FIRM|nr:hypothetical protein DWX78_01305 [Dorea formicigenerans]